MINFVINTTGTPTRSKIDGRYLVTYTGNIEFYSRIVGTWYMIFDGDTAGMQWLEIDGVEYKAMPGETADEYIARIAGPLHNAVIDETLGVLD